MAAPDNIRLSPWSPLRHPVFRAIWITAIISNIGTWMQSVGGVWLMTSLTTSTLLVALMQTATSLPVFLVTLPAGAVADIVDRRHMLLFTQGWMCAAAGALAGLTFLNLTNPTILLALTFALGLGSAANVPVWQAVVPGLVSREELPSAVALNGVAFNIARAVGPALAGAVVAVAGPSFVFLFNALSFAGVLWVLYRWDHAPKPRSLPAEHVIGGIRTGARYALHAPELRTALIRCSIFIAGSAALWALMPVVARHELDLDSIGFGWLFGCIGVGALIGAGSLPWQRRRFTTDGLVMAASVAFGAVTLALGFVQNVVFLSFAMVVAGLAWMAAMASFTVMAQTVVPSWVQARALGFYALAFQGGLAVASVVWGAIAQRSGTSLALSLAAFGLVAGLAAARRWPLRSGPGEDLSPSMHWPEPSVMAHPDPDDGPVLVTVEYHIDPSRAADFVTAMHKLRVIRRRDGARRWGIFRDLEIEGRYVETFVVDSWAEHLRQHSRTTNADRVVEDLVHSFHLENSRPAVAHLLYECDRGGNHHGHGPDDRDPAEEGADNHRA